MKKYLLRCFIVCLILFTAAYALGFLSGEGRYVEGFLLTNDDLSYTGYIKDGKLTGDGRIEFVNGDIYEGGFKDGRFNGYGTYISADGWRFEGEFENGAVVTDAGKAGIFTDTDGRAGIRLLSENGRMSVNTQEFLYTGMVDRRGQSGYGEMTLTNGEVYKGDFYRGYAHGKGVFTDASGRTVYEGGFDEGLFHGYGILTPPGGVYEYRGSFADGLFNGYGEYYTDGKLVYKGDFVYGLPDGDGIYYAPDGEVYIGVFTNGYYLGGHNE